MVHNLHNVSVPMQPSAIETVVLLFATGHLVTRCGCANRWTHFFRWDSLASKAELHGRAQRDGIR